MTTTERRPGSIKRDAAVATEDISSDKRSSSKTAIGGYVLFHLLVQYLWMKYMGEQMFDGLLAASWEKVCRAGNIIFNEMVM